MRNTPLVIRSRIHLAAIKLKKKDELTGAKDAVDGVTALDLAKERRQNLETKPPKGIGEDQLLDDKRKCDKMIEYLEKGVSS